MTRNRQRILVAGATGYLGGFVAREFKSRGHFVRALARSARKLDHMKDEFDEIVEGEITVPESIKDVCDDIDVVFSSVGITKQKDKLTFKDVDYQGNMNLLEVARKAGVKKFIYVSVFNGPNLLHLDIVKAHEDFVAELKASDMDYAVIRPTGYFSDMGAFFEMAGKGRVYLFGPGNNEINPIHGADLAVTCVDAMEGQRQEIDVGGPEVLTLREIAALALETQAKPARITCIPLWLTRLIVAVTRFFNRHLGELLAFLTTATTIDGVAPRTGTHTLKAFYEECAQKGTNECKNLSFPVTPLPTVKSKSTDPERIVEGIRDGGGFE
ncbi:SDR family oxidoreductase [Thermodesulfobacteriota bacterium]